MPHAHRQHPAVPPQLCITALPLKQIHVFKSVDAWQLDSCLKCLGTTCLSGIGSCPCRYGGNNGANFSRLLEPGVLLTWHSYCQLDYHKGFKGDFHLVWKQNSNLSGCSFTTGFERLSWIQIVRFDHLNFHHNSWWLTWGLKIKTWGFIDYCLSVTYFSQKC